MKKMLFLALCTLSLTSFAQDIVLPAPQTDGGKSFRYAIANRRTIRNFTGGSLSMQQLSDLCFSACGMNRKTEKKLTIPTAVNAQDLVLYAATKDGIYRYDAEKHILKQLKKGDFRSGFGMQKTMFEKAAAVLIYTSDLSKLKFVKTEAEKKMYAGVHAGFAIQNAGLFCAAEGLGNVVIGSYDRKKTPELLGLDDMHPVLMVQLTGIPE